MATTLGELIAQLQQAAERLPTGLLSPVMAVPFDTDQEYRTVAVHFDPDGDDMVTLDLS